MSIRSKNITGNAAGSAPGKEEKLMGEKKRSFKAFLDRLDYYRTLPHKNIGVVEDGGNHHCLFTPGCFYVDLVVSFPYHRPFTKYLGTESSIKEKVIPKYSNGCKISFHSLG
jgi:hypothetical protein